jgi:hypothetical protein
MTSFSYSQQQLLKLLQISPLALAVRSPATDANHTTMADITSPLAQDIVELLGAKLTWLIKRDLTAPQLLQNQILTPPLSLLQLAEQKKALWALISSALDDI